MSFEGSCLLRATMKLLQGIGLLESPRIRSYMQVKMQTYTRTIDAERANGRVQAAPPIEIKYGLGRRQEVQSD
jgi:hypothetical protein